MGRVRGTKSIPSVRPFGLVFAALATVVKSRFPLLDRRAIGLCLSTLLLGLAAEAQPVFDTVTRASGLPSDYVNTLYQDRFGFLWFGTDAGLARYDGQDVETFTANDGLPHPFVYAVSEDGAGDLWVGTFQGLARFDGDRFETVEEPFGSVLVGGLGLDDEGRLLVRSEVGVARREGDRWRKAQGRRGALSETWGGVLPLADGRLVAGGSLGGRGALFLFTARGSGFDVVDVPVPGRVGSVTRVADGGDGTLLLYGDADEGSVFRVRIEGERAVGIGSAELGAIRLIEPGPDGGGAVALGGGRSGVYRLSPGLKLGPERLYPGPIETLAFDYEGSLWIGTFGQGALRLHDGRLDVWVPEPATRVALGPDGTVWASGDGLWQIDASTGQARRAYAGREIREVRAGAGRDLWLSEGGAIFRGGGLGRPLRTFRADGGWVSGIEVAADTVWVSTYSGGVERIVRGEVHALREGRGLPTDMVEGLERTQGAVWALTRSHGAFRLVGDRAEPVGPAQGLPSSAVYSVYEAADGATWFGTDRGVARLAPGADRAVVFGEEILSGQRVTALFEREGFVWVVGDRTVYAVDEDQVWAAEAGAILPDPQSSINDAVYDPRSGRLVLATTRAVLGVDLNALPSRRRPPPRVAVRGVRIGDEPQRLLGTPLAARLRPVVPGRHRVEVAVAPLSFVGGVRTEVRLNDGAWSDVGREARVVFPDLGPGDHVLAVRAVAGPDRVSDAVATLAFEIRPHWWQHPAVVTLGSLLTLALFVSGVRHASQRRLRSQVRALEVERRLHDERERISRDLHDHVGAQLSSLLAGVELARLERRASGARDPGAPGPSDVPGDPLDSVEADARATMRQLRETIWAIHGEHVTIEDFASRVRQDVAARHTSLETEVHWEGGEQALSPVQALNLFRITQEAVTNVLKHADARTLSVTVRHTGRDVSVEVADDGNFQPPAGGDGLSGFGLRSMRARAARLGGRVEIEVDDGTTVRVEVPAHA